MYVCIYMLCSVYVHYINYILYTCINIYAIICVMYCFYVFVFAFVFAFEYMYADWDVFTY